MRLWQQANDWLINMANMVFPPVCGNCRQVGEAVCADCVRQMVRVAEPFCQSCGRPDARGILCEKCRHSPLNLTQIRSTFIFAPPLKKFIHQLKYENKFGLARSLGDLMAQKMPAFTPDPTMVIPIALHPDRQKERGYNQSELLAKQIAKKHPLIFSSHALQRVRNTPPQMRLNAIERQSNMAEAFQAKDNLVKNQNILLIDDVYTTGATLSAAAQALLNAGANAVMGYCLAQAASSYQHTY